MSRQRPTLQIQHLSSQKLMNVCQLPFVGSSLKNVHINVLHCSKTTLGGQGRI